jgi:hypothetical protein
MLDKKWLYVKKTSCIIQNNMASWQHVYRMDVIDQSVLKDLSATDVMAEPGIYCPTPACSF